MSRGGPRGLGLRVVRAGPTRVKGAAHRCATACGPPLTREPLPALGQALSGRPGACPMGARSPSPFLWVDRVVVTRAGSSVGKVASFVGVAFEVFV